MKLRTWTSLIALSAFSLNAAAQDNGKKNLEKLCGCYSVNFKYAETFSPDAKYKFQDREDMSAIELALPIESTDKKLVIQHLLVVMDTMIVKHWREEWVYEQPVIVNYLGDKKWEKQTLTTAEVKGKWTQTVWEVSDEPRYQGVSYWISNDHKTYWESTADAPLPRREYTHRSDYNILRRHNRITLNDSGYVHEQDNDKILRTGGKDKLIAQEKGYNSYYKTEESECAVARTWWEKNKSFWAVVRKEWQGIMAANSSVTMHDKVDNKMLNEHLTALWKEWSRKNVSDSDLPGKVHETIYKFMQNTTAAK